MRTDITTIDSSGSGIQLALNRIEGLADVEQLSKKDRLHLRLLAEETFGMVTAIVGNFSAKFWAEGENRNFRIILQADADVDETEKAQLLSVSSTGMNIAGRGVMEKIWNLYRMFIGSGGQAPAMKEIRGMTSGKDEVSYGELGAVRVEDGKGGENYAWSLKQYRTNVKNAMDKDTVLQGAWDELGKSIVANIASDIQVGVSDDQVKMVIYLIAA